MKSENRTTILCGRPLAARRRAPEAYAGAHSVRPPM